MDGKTIVILKNYHNGSTHKMLASEWAKVRRMAGMNVFGIIETIEPLKKEIIKEHKEATKEPEKARS